MPERVKARRWKGLGRVGERRFGRRFFFFGAEAVLRERGVAFETGGAAQPSEIADANDDRNDRREGRREADFVKRRVFRAAK